MYIPKEEQETTISFCRDSELADLWTNDRTIITKLDKLVLKYPNSYQIMDIGISGIDKEILYKKYRFNKRLLSYKSFISKRTITDEQRDSMRNRALLLHKSDKDIAERKKQTLN